MANEVRLMSVACNLKCTYCYQNPQRDAGNINTMYDIDAVIERLDGLTTEFHLFGGEALLVPKEDLERMWHYGYRRFERNGVQTNGVLIDDDHIALFKKYNVGIGISIDGAGDLNDMRWAGSLDRTRETTQKILDNIVKLRNESIGVSVITTLHKLNATAENLPRLKQFFRWLGDIGVKEGNIHLLEVDNEIVANMYCLTSDETIYAFMELAQFFDENPDLSWQPFNEMPKMLMADDEKATCYWKRCDPMNTQAVYGIEGDGALSNCGRTNKDGIDMYKADSNGYERYIGLYYTPDEMGGCKGCRFWSICGGSCVGEAEKGDWRNKTSNCRTMKSLLSHYEERLVAEGKEPITLSPHLYEIEQYMLSNLAMGQQCYLSQAAFAVRTHGSYRVVPVGDYLDEVDGKIKETIKVVCGEE